MKVRIGQMIFRLGQMIFRLGQMKVRLGQMKVRVATFFCGNSLPNTTLVVRTLLPKSLYQPYFLWNEMS